MRPMGEVSSCGSCAALFASPTCPQTHPGARGPCLGPHASLPQFSHRQILAAQATASLHGAAGSRRLETLLTPFIKIYTTPYQVALDLFAPAGNLAAGLEERTAGDHA